MKQFIRTLALFVTCIAFAQQKDYYVKNGAAIEGYDVVSYFNHKPTQGKKEFTTQYNGVQFRFANAKNLAKFKANPTNYLPQYGGWCAYALGKNNKKYSINPETYQIKNKKLYLFYNSWGTNTLHKWKEENPEELRKQADKNWASYQNKK
ncbi:YHS domain-containing (seleno)protein [Ochrovirga pacifica]|uniref:YHS domain-containing (seleno)protein n=1 Tax=Ochrovirga pacifica TaxID=1042376 RepID=UPI0002559547|nr:YHS domain-containing (seleno)protein [Ochrovirga pacifica]